MAVNPAGAVFALKGSLNKHTESVMKKNSIITWLFWNTAAAVLLLPAALRGETVAMAGDDLAVYAGGTLWIADYSVVEGSAGAGSSISLGREVSVSGDVYGHSTFAMQNGGTIGGSVIVSGDFSADMGGTMGAVQAGGTLSLANGSSCDGFRAVGDSYAAPDSILNGDAVSGGSLTFGRRVAVYGNVYHKGSYWADSGVVIHGDVTPINDAPSIDLWSFDLTDTSPQSSDSGFVWYRNDSVQYFSPGSYGRISAGKRVKIHLTSAGTYNFRSIYVDNDTEFIVDVESGEVVINIQESLSADSGAGFIHDANQIQMEIHTGGSVWFGGGCLVEADVYAGGSLSADAGVRIYGIAHSGGDISFDSNVHVFAHRTGASAEAEIDVKGNGKSIIHGDMSPGISDHTDFGDVSVEESGTAERTYTIVNLGSAALTIGGVSVDGPHADEFSVAVAADASVDAGGSTTFRILFDPEEIGTRTATVSIANNDSNENPYRFGISGNGIASGCVLILPEEEIPVGMTHQTVSSNLLQLVEDALPEYHSVDQTYLDPVYDMNLVLSEEGRVSVTFIDEGAAYKNSLGYYAYPAGALDGLTKTDVDADGSGIVTPCELTGAADVEYGWVFPNASKEGYGGRLQPGDTVALGNGKVFDANTVIGFFLVQNSWTGSEVSIDVFRQIFYTTDFLNPEAGPDADSQTDSSANRSRHVAMLFADGAREEIVMGIEDMDRLGHSDDDFNDAVFIVQSDPPEAFENSDIPSVDTTYSFTTEKLLAFEDLKLQDWCDWDYNDVLLYISGTCETNAYGHVYSMTLEYELMARGAGYDHEVYLSFDAAGTSSSTVTTYSAGGELLTQTVESHEDDLTLALYDSTTSALPPSLTNHWKTYANTCRWDPETQSTRVKVELVFDDPALNPFGKAFAAPYDTWIHVVNTGEEIHRPVFQLSGNLQLCQNGPLAGQALPLALDFDAGLNWPEEEAGIWNSHEEFVDYIESGMLEHEDWWNTYDLDFVWVDEHGELPGDIYGPASSPQMLAMGSYVAAVDPGSSDMIRLYGSDAWPVNLGAEISASPVIRDLTGNGEMEILIAGQDGRVHILTADGAELAGWPQQCEAGLRASPGIGNLDADPEPEIVIGTDAGGTNGWIRAWNLDGTIVDGYPVQMGAPVKCVPSVVDVTGDGAAEIVVYAGDGNLHVLRSDGNPVQGWPVRLSGDADSYGSWLLASSPVVCDLDGDGVREICIGSVGGDVYVFHADGRPAEGWPQKTGRDSVYASVTLADLQGDFTPELVIGSGDGKVYAWSIDGMPVDGYPIHLGNPIIASVAAADLDGIPGEELVAFTAGTSADDPGEVYVLGQDGAVFSGWPQRCASSYRSVTPSPILADVDGDQLPDIIAAGADRKLHAWDVPGGMLSGFPCETSGLFESTPAAADLDGDGTLDLIFCSHDGLLRRIELDGAAAPWPCFRGDRAQRTDGDALDSDNDSLSDAFEIISFGTLARSASEDSDGDGLNNAAEFVARTDPADASSGLVLGSGKDAFGSYIYWEARPGCTYWVEASCDLASGEWIPVSDELTGEGPMGWDPPVDDACVFYRLRVRR